MFEHYSEIAVTLSEPWYLVEGCTGSHENVYRYLDRCTYTSGKKLLLHVNMRNGELKC